MTRGNKEGAWIVSCKGRVRVTMFKGEMSGN